MKTTGKQIIIKNVLIGGHFENVPVMRNGKPTKRTKRTYIEDRQDAVADSYLIEDHEVYIIRQDLEQAYKSDYKNICLYREDGTRISAECLFGSYGQSIHTKIVMYNVSTDKIEVDSCGYNGPCGKGSRAYIKRINW